MRRNVLIFILVNVAVITYLVHSVWILLTLLVVDGSSDAIRPAELPSPNSTLLDNIPRLIPKIIHQTYKNESIPAHWVGPQQSCIEQNPDFEYKFWTDASAREFIRAEYPWFLETWDAYPYNIERADAIRYFILAHYGGIYIDLDDGCNRPLDPLLQFPAWVRRTSPTGISNDAMGAIPQHPFFLRAIDSLQAYKRNWLLPYITVMGSTGPLFLSVIWRHYNSDGATPTGMDRVRILSQKEYVGQAWSFFTHNRGSSWHDADLQLILWLRNHWFFLTVTGFLVAGGIFYGCYSLLTASASSIPDSPRLHHTKLRRWRLRSLLPFRSKDGYQRLEDGLRREMREM